jgi:hypothetical protein
MSILTSHSRTLISDDETSLLTWLGALRQACAGHELRPDAAEFLRQTAHLPEELAVIATPDGFFLVRDEHDQPLAWYPRDDKAAGAAPSSTPAPDA